jgi:hypothetical protein
MMLPPDEAFDLPDTAWPAVLAWFESVFGS